MLRRSGTIGHDALTQSKARQERQFRWRVRIQMNSDNNPAKLEDANPQGRGDLDYIDTSAYRFEAVVDWFAFQIETVEPTQFHHIQKHLTGWIGSKPYVCPIDPDTGKRKRNEGGTSTVFHFKVFDEIANNGQKLLELFAYLTGKFPLARVPLVIGIEIALDAYSRSGSDNALQMASLWMMEHLSAPPVNVRQYDPSRRTKNKNIMFDQESRTLAINPELNFRTGNREDDLSFQVYWKRTDKPDDEDGGRGGKELPRHQQRARAEFTLVGDRLATEGIHTLDHLAAFDLGRLARHLRFANLMPLAQATTGMDALKATSLRSVWDERAVCMAPGWMRRETGSDGHRRHAQPAPRKHSRYTTPNKGMNRIVSDRFAQLGARYLAKKNNEN